MTDALLQNKPLVEALFEFRWSVGSREPGESVDPHYKLLPGRFYERAQAKYPHHEQLPTATMPDEVAAYLVQHRFRVAADEWPLVQIGPGILSLNVTDAYSWDDFRARIEAAVVWLFDAHPASAAMLPESLLLRYIDALDFDTGHRNIFDFLAQMMGVTIAYPSSLFDGSHVHPVPQQFLNQAAFACANPPGLVTLGFASGTVHDAPALVWETAVQSNGAQIPAMPAALSHWLENAHQIIHDWFFALIAGDLEKEFR